MSETKSAPTYLRAVRSLEIADYPLGGSRRGVARYWVESSKRGERIARETEQKPDSGTFNKPKRSKYGRKAAILIGDDERTYCALWSNGFDMLTIYDSAIKHQIDSIFPGAVVGDRDRFNHVRQLIEGASE